MKNKYRNPWFRSCNTPRPEFYENDAPKVFEYRGVVVFELWRGSFDYVLGDCCITQRAGMSKATEVIDEILDGETPVDNTVAKHLRACGHSPITYDEYSTRLIEIAAQAVEEIGEDELERAAAAKAVA